MNAVGAHRSSLTLAVPVQAVPARLASRAHGQREPVDTKLTTREIDCRKTRKHPDRKCPSVDVHCSAGTRTARSRVSWLVVIMTPWKGYFQVSRSGGKGQLWLQGQPGSSCCTGA
jgi:hypothetical protein